MMSEMFPKDISALDFYLLMRDQRVPAPFITSYIVSHDRSKDFVSSFKIQVSRDLVSRDLVSRDLVSRDLVASFKIQVSRDLVSRDLVSSFKIQSSGAAGFRFQDSGFRVDKT